MIILPDRNISRPKILLSVHSAQWREPSQAQPKDYFGRSNQTRFRIRARLNDGHVVWCGWFDDREDFDRFLWAIVSGELWRDPYIRRLPTPQWPGLDPSISYDFATVTFLTSPTGSNQTFTSPSDWDNNSNSIEPVGGGASGAVIMGSAGTGTASGGGAGAYSKITSFNFATPGTTTAIYQIGIGGASVARSSSTGNTAGNAGGSSWFNASSDPGNGADNSKCSAAGGGPGTGGTITQNGGPGGATTASWGTTKFAGGNGGNGSQSSTSTGAGAAAGPDGAGNNGVTPGAGFTATAGATSDAGSDAGGTAGAASTTNGVPAGNGGNGTKFDAGHGLGGGGGAGRTGVAGGAATGGTGGNYGGAGGGANVTATTGTVTSGAGGQGMIVVTYTPLAASIPGGNQISNPVHPPSRSYSFLSGINLDLIGQDAMVPGKQSTELPKANPPTSWQPSYPTAWAWSYNLNLIGKDQLPAGQRHYETPKGFQLTSWIRTWTHFEPLTITGVLPIGARSYETPQRFPATSWPASWAWSYNLNLIGKDTLPAGRQIAEPGRAYPYPLDLRTTTLNLSFLLQRPPIAQYDWPLPVPQHRILQSWVTPSAPFWLRKPFLQTEWPLPTAPWRSPSLSTWVDPFKINLIGQDAMAPGRQSTELAPGVPLTSWIRTWTKSALPIVLPTPLPVNQYDWPLPVSPRPAHQLRTWEYSINLNLLGKDVMTPGGIIDRRPREAPPPVPSWTRSFPLSLIGADALPVRQQDWPLPIARGFFRPSPVQYLTLGFVIGQPFNQYHWPIPIAPRYATNLRSAAGLNALQLALITMPPGRSIYDLTGRPPHPISLRGYVLSLRPQAFLSSIPFRQVDWPLPTPQRPSVDLRTWIDPLKLNLHGRGTGFFVYDRPLPRRQPDQDFSYAYSRFPGLIPTSFAVCAHTEVTAFVSTTRISSATSQTSVDSPLTSNTKFSSC